jgi:hypothetical protein
MKSRMKRTIVLMIAVPGTVLSVFIAINLDAGNFFQNRLKPDHHFVVVKVPPAPDYGDDRMWAALPSKQDEADLSPQGVEADRRLKAPADVFYIHPTGYFGSDNWNSPIDPKSSAYDNIRLMLASQASAFNACCNVYAPHYREATFYSFVDNGNDGLQALDLAYSDVARAFNYYLLNYNRGRPLIIASHSQGSVHALRLLEEKIDNTYLYGRLVAAYIIGSSVPVEKLRRSFSRIRQCSSATDTGCLISWNTYAAGASPVKMRHVWYRHGWEKIDDKDLLCTNPLSWNNDEKIAPDTLHHGAIIFQKGELWQIILARMTGRKTPIMLPSPVRQKCSARCAKGFLYVSAVKEIIDLYGRGNYHMYDYSLFYMNIRENAIARTDAFLKKK